MLLAQPFNLNNKRKDMKARKYNIAMKRKNFTSIQNDRCDYTVNDLYTNITPEHWFDVQHVVLFILTGIRFYYEHIFNFIASIFL